MQIELNRATFRRLVQLYAVSLVLLCVTVAAELFVSEWLAFSDEFDAIVARRFGASGFDTAPYWAFGSIGAVLIWMIASIVGLLSFKRWARFGNWASVLVGFVPMLVFDGYTPSYTSPAVDLVSEINCGLFGAIVLLSYAKGLGADWFGSPLTDVKE